MAPGTHLHRSSLKLCSISYFSTAFLLSRPMKHAEAVLALCGCGATSTSGATSLNSLRHPLLSLGVCRCLLGKDNAHVFWGNPAAAVHDDLDPVVSVMAACSWTVL